MTDFMTPPAHAMAAPSGPVWLSEDGIIITISMHPVQDLQVARENMKITKQLAAGVSRPMLVDITRVRSMKKEAREEYVTPESRQFVNSVALITNSGMGSMVGNLFIQLNKHVVPIKLFTDPNKAKEWLMQYKVNQ